MHKTTISLESTPVVLQFIPYAWTRYEHSFTDFLDIYPYRGRGLGSELLGGKMWPKTKIPPVTPGRRWSFLHSTPDPLKPTVGEKNSKICKKGRFYPKKGQKWRSQSFQSKFDRYHRNQRPKKRWGPLAHQNLTVSLKVGIFELQALYP